MLINSERLYLRPVSMDDKESMYAYRSDSETSKYLSLIPESVEDIAKLIDKTSKEIEVAGTWFQFVIIKKYPDLLIGDIGIHFLDNGTDNKQVEIGYTLSNKYRNKGYATEALTNVINFLINDLQKHRIIASIDPTNKDSIKLIEKLGFRKEAHFVKSLLFHGEWVDDVIYAMLGDDWQIRPN